MKYVIEISEEEYAGIVKSNYPNDQLVGELIYAVKNGIPLPEHHGRLIDANMLRKNWVFGSREKIEIDAAPTIIPATKEGE